MIWHMDIGTWLYYFLLPWGTFVFTVVYGVYWLISSQKKDMAKLPNNQVEKQSGQ